MTRWVIATNNQHKVREIGAILREFGIECVSMRDIGVRADPDETGATFVENALIKAFACFDATGLPSIADDSGIVVDALDGAPGMYSARYGGDGLTDAERTALLLRNMETIPERERSARFVSAIACVLSRKRWLTVRGNCEGRVTYAPRGEGGFGYDSVFVPEGSDRTFAELSPEEKNKISHRAIALRELRVKLMELKILC